MVDRILSGVIAVSLALLIWLYARSRDQEVLDHVPIPVEVNLSSASEGQYSLEVTGPAQVMATFTGPPSRIRELRSLLQRDRLNVELNYAVPADRLKENRLHETLVVEAANLSVPPGVTAAMVAGRNQVRIVLHKLGEKQLPVRADPNSEREAGPCIVEPSTVTVRGPMEVLERSTAIVTQPFIRPDSPLKQVVSVPLVLQLDGRTVSCEPGIVKVRPAGSAGKRCYELPDVPVHFLTPSGFPLRPRGTGKVTLYVVGPSQEELPHASAFVDLTDRRFLEGKRVRSREEPVRVHLPRGFRLEDVQPATVTFDLEER